MVDTRVGPWMRSLINISLYHVVLCVQIFPTSFRVLDPFLIVVVWYAILKQTSGKIQSELIYCSTNEGDIHYKESVTVKVRHLYNLEVSIEMGIQYDILFQFRHVYICRSRKCHACIVSAQTSQRKVVIRHI